MSKAAPLDKHSGDRVSGVELKASRPRVRHRGPRLVLPGIPPDAQRDNTRTDGDDEPRGNPSTPKILKEPAPK